MTFTLKQTGLVGIVGVLIGALLTAYACNSKATSTVPVQQLKPVATTIVVPVHDTVVTYIQGKTIDGVRVDTQYIKAPFWLVDTVRVHDTTIRQPAPFSLPGVFALATPIIASFKPPEPVNVLELYVHADHDLFAGGYGGGAELDLRLDQLHITPLILYADVGYDHSFHLEVGGRGKLWGAW